MANTLNYSINNKEVSFSSKSLTINDKEYLYKDITAIKHSSAKCLYLFKVDGKWHELFYDEAHKKGVSTIFKKIADHLAAVRKAKAAAEVAAIEAAVEAKAEPAVEEPAPVAEPEPVAEEAPAEEAPAEEAPSLIEALAQTEGIPAEPVEETPAEEVPAEEETPEEVPAEEETPAEEEAPAEEVPAEEETPEEVPAEEEAPAEEETPEEVPVEEEAPAEEKPAEEVPAEVKADEPDKKSKKKKAFIVFAIIIALFIIAGIIYFFTIGLPSESSPSEQDTTHQYNDIEELIDEMQE